MATEAENIRAALKDMSERIRAHHNKVTANMWPPSGADYNRLLTEVVNTMLRIENIKPEGHVMELLPKGEIIEKDKLVMTQHIGNASSPNGEEFEMMTSMSFSPMIECKRTGKKFHLPWHDVIDMAVAKGITED